MILFMSCNLDFWKRIDKLCLVLVHNLIECHMHFYIYIDQAVVYLVAVYAVMHDAW